MPAVGAHGAIHMAGSLSKAKLCEAGATQVVALLYELRYTWSFEPAAKSAFFLRYGP